MTSEAKLIQSEFLDRVKSSLPAHVSLVDELADLLSISNDSSYRRLRGETLFSIVEIAIICKHFRVAFDPHIQHQSNSVTFDYQKIEGNYNNFAKWLNAMATDVKRISHQEGNKVIYAADDVPIWHHFFDEELVRFKLFYWLKSIVSEPNFIDCPFEPKKIDSVLVSNAKQLLTNYNGIESIEIWNEDTMNSTFKQVEYFWESGFFESSAVALRICDLLLEEINLLQKKAAKSSKLIEQGESGKENFTLYKSEVMIGNNSIIANIGKTKIAYVSNNTFNMMSTTNQGFIEENENWIKNLLKKSTIISGVSEKQRNQFFKVLKDKLDIVKSKIN